MFERKWQQLPRFQQTRGILRLLALWVSHAYQAGFKGAHKDALIVMGTAPLDDPMFRSAAFEQLGGAKLEGAVTTDICGKKESHAVRLDKEAVDSDQEGTPAPKSRNVDILRVERWAIQDRSHASRDKARCRRARHRHWEYRNGFGDAVDDLLFLVIGEESLPFQPIAQSEQTSCGSASQRSSRRRSRRGCVQKFRRCSLVATGVGRVYFPEKSGQITDRPVLSLVVMSPEQSISDKATRDFIESATKESGTSGRTYKSGLVWAVPDSPDALRDEARKVLAWEDIADEEDELRLDEAQKRQLAENVKKAQRDAKEIVWRTYKNLMLLGKDNSWKTVDLGLVHSSAAKSIVELILNRLRQDGDIEDAVSPSFLARNWPPAFKEWSTKSVRDAFFASPQFPRLLNSESLKDTIARGVENRDARLRGQEARWQLCSIPLEIVADGFRCGTVR